MNLPRRRLVVLVALALAIAAATWFLVARPTAHDPEEPSPRSASREPSRGASQGRDDARRGPPGDGRGAGEAAGPITIRGQERLDRALRETTRNVRVGIVPLGETPPTLGRETLGSALADIAPSIGQCFAEQRGRLEFAEVASLDGGVRAMRTVDFDLTPEGAVVPSSIGITPPLEPRYADCITTRVRALSVGPVGTDGARISVPLRALRAVSGGGSDGGVSR